MNSKFTFKDDFTGEVLGVLVCTMKEAQETKKQIEEETGCYVRLEKSIFF